MGKLDEILAYPPPPSYEKVAQHRMDGHGRSRCGLSVGLWLAILSLAVDGRQPKEEQAVAWAHLHRDVRFVCKDLYMLSMHLLRSHNLQRYMARVRAPYTSDPFPEGDLLPPPPDPATAAPQMSYASSSTASSQRAPPYRASATAGGGAGRETRVLDLYIAATVRSDIEAFESSLLESTLGDDEQGESDLFTVHQPQCRLEDLVIALGRQHGVIKRPHDEERLDEKHKRPALPPVRANAIEAHDLAIELSSRKASLRIRNHQSTSRALRTVLEVPRQRNDPLERIAHDIVGQLRHRLN